MIAGDSPEKLDLIDNLLSGFDTSEWALSGEERNLLGGSRIKPRISAATENQRLDSDIRRDHTKNKKNR